MAYSNDQLFNAVQARRRVDADFNNKLNQAVRTKNFKWIDDLVEWVAEITFGAIITRVVNATIDILLGG